MLEETASVVSLEGEKAKVVLVRSDACGACAAKDMCHTSSGETMEMVVLISAEAKPVDRVIVSLPPGELLKASASAYLLPLTESSGIIGIPAPIVLKLDKSQLFESGLYCPF